VATYFDILKELVVMNTRLPELVDYARGYKAPTDKTIRQVRDYLVNDTNQQNADIQLEMASNGNLVLDIHHEKTYSGFRFDGDSVYPIKDGPKAKKK
jgi:hypothetical protein